MVEDGSTEEGRNCSERAVLSITGEMGLGGVYEVTMVGAHETSAEGRIGEEGQCSTTWGAAS